MNRKNITVWIAAVAALMCVSLLGAYALQVHQIEREIASLPLVQLEQVIIRADRAQTAGSSTQVAKNPTATTLR